MKEPFIIEQIRETAQKDKTRKEKLAGYFLIYPNFLLPDLL